MEDAIPYLDKPYYSVICVASPIAGEEGALRNHWRLFLSLGESAGCIILDMVKTDYQDLRGYFAVTYKTYSLTSSYSLLALLYPMTPALKQSTRTLRDLLEHLYAKKLLTYKYNDPHNGCRYWIKCVTESLKENGFIDNEDGYNGLMKDINWVWRQPGLGEAPSNAGKGIQVEESTIKQGAFNF